MPIEFPWQIKYQMGRRSVEPKISHLKPPTFIPNSIRTAKYSLLSFFPVCLFRQFSRPANIYFLAIAIVQSIPSISPLNPVTAILPLVFVIAVSMLREAVEDWRRHQEDERVNSTKTWVLRESRSSESSNTLLWHKVPWREVQVGDIVKVLQDELFPADLVLLSSAHEGGIAHVMTMNLDGETNLKFRKPALNSDSAAYTPGLSPTLEGIPSKDSLTIKIEADEPRNALDRFDAFMKKRGEVEQEGESSTAPSIPLSIGSFLPREAMLKSTPWAVGVAVYTGAETKAMLGLLGGQFKQSWIDRAINWMVLTIIGLQCSLCLIAGIISGCWTSSDGSGMWYVSSALRTPSLEGFQNSLSFFLLLNTLVPISLLVSIEIVKLLQTFPMDYDRRMRYRWVDAAGQEQTVNFKCRTSTLNEDLGQVGYVFSDKTGTLTSNCLEFRGVYFGGFLCGHSGSQVEQAPLTTIAERLPIADETTVVKSTARLQNARPSIAGIIPERVSSGVLGEFESALKNSNMLVTPVPLGSALIVQTVSEMAQHIALLLALCHEVSPDGTRAEGDISKIVYAGESPDEVCLVETARKLGFALKGRDSRSVVLSVNAQEQRWQVAYTIPFSNARKRSSVLVRRTDKGGDYILYSKGADDTMLPLVVPDSYLTDTGEKLTEFSRAGLRTLVLGARVVNEVEGNQWLEKVRSAECETDAEKREKALTDLYEQMESNMSLLGVTATEDKLQEYVPEAIEALRRAKIAVWMITGDKLETGIEIAKSCRLINPTDEVAIVDGVETFEEAQKRTTSKLDCVVVTGRAMETLLMPSHRENFRALVMKCKTVVCCRTSKDQKAQMVQLVKEKSKMLTLAIGDGANDVPMIRKAHLGIGVFGKEGRQAVQNSDYAVGRFFHIERLLLFHGRLNYSRVAKTVVFFFFKNLAFTVSQFLFGTANFFSGSTYYESYYITCFNLIFTALPVFVLGVLEKDASREDPLIGVREAVWSNPSKDIELGTQNSVGSLPRSTVASSLAVDNTIVSATRLRQMAYPRLYFTGQYNTEFSPRVLLTMEVCGMAVGSLLYCLAQYGEAAQSNGQMGGLWFNSQLTYSCVVGVALSFILVFAEAITLPMVVAVGYSYIMYLSYIFATNFITLSVERGVAALLFASPSLYLWAILTLFLILGGYSAYVAATDRFYPTVKSLWKEARAGAQKCCLTQR